MKKYFILALFMVYAASVSCQTIFNLRNDGTILKDNQQFFPMGFYIDRGTIASYKTMVDSLAAGGTFNLVNLPFVYEGNAAWTSFLDYCAGNNVFFNVSSWNKDVYLIYLQTTKGRVVKKFIVN